MGQVDAVHWIEEHVPATVLGVPDGQLVREEADGLPRRPSEDQPGILGVAQVEAPQCAKVRALLAFGAEPGQRPVHQHAVEHQQTLKGLLDGRPAAVPIVGVADGPIARLVVDVEQARPPVRPESDGPRVPVRQQAREEVVHLLPVRDAGEGRVLAPDEHARVAKDEVEESVLALGHKAPPLQVRRSKSRTDTSERLVKARSSPCRNICDVCTPDWQQKWPPQPLSAPWTPRLQDTTTERGLGVLP